MVRANLAKTVLQNAADAATIAGATSGITDEDDLRKIVEDYVRANGGEHYVTYIEDVDTDLNTTERTFSVTIDAKLNTSLMQVVNIDNMDISAYSEVILAGSGLEVALVLDNTSSMNAAGRLPALKLAATNLVNDLLALNATGADVKIGIVPFSEYANVGTTYQTAPWMTYPEGLSKTVNSCWMTYPNAVSSNCHMVDGTYMDDGQPVNYQYESCEWDYGDPVEVCGDTTYTWQGCVGSRDNPKDEVINSLGIPYSGLLAVTCPSPLSPLTDNATQLTNNINSLVATGSTYIPAGLLWGWNLLDANEPIGGAKTHGEMTAVGGKKAIVLMTDGANTLSATYPFHKGNDVSAANAKTEALCDNIKDDDIVIYTVAFMVTDTTAVDLLAGCASDPGKVFTADNPEALIQAFHDIGSQLAAIRFSK
jgi:Mg-chelatase subunit ChlD